ncbi:MAG: hypothetical protein UY23_C0004G0030 [Candidatus Jorgensenbacteria bacterium GW2011_GWA1_48_11]|uniref:Polymerase nucleotidyl transferase domain-containing protein n=1 Tax=Candidatus Jorgensenbacteria bacterium GW2011_GWA1_48_11 TaxID=1618660 RepID=A0A0G1X9R3_9BACT|nr:MAG: hypothetical protein UY23_C0004G0030 [Candidatus Jorgensenbacteria bacterium GW2011_GWA1_48_11]KKW11789.1 MAG: hypothetical protein UY51_C0005G0030 [Candidatus Jorgensenbacteria bacterium GW2011_GWB1_49_9]
MNGKINEILSFYGALGRPLTFLEIRRSSGGEPAKISVFLEREAQSGAIVEDNGFFYLKEFKEISGLSRRRQDFLLQKKWRRLLRRRHWFDWVPFLDFVLASGSMAIGNVNDKSDFDILAGIKAGRIFTARYLILLVFTLLGVRRPDDKEDSSPDKFCFNHFVTAETWSKPPYNVYRRSLYQNLVPIYGREEKIKGFIEANGWADIGSGSLLDLRFEPRKFNLGRRFLEIILSGKLGDYVENKILAPLAKRRLKKYVRRHNEQGRVVVGDQELEFHFKLPYEQH